jgi:hypothetical protein
LKGDLFHCQYCQKAFKQTKSNHMFCSSVCADAAKYRRKNPKLRPEYRHCLVCNKIYKPKTIASIFCSRVCVNVYYHQVAYHRNKQKILEQGKQWRAKNYETVKNWNRMYQRFGTHQLPQEVKDVCMLDYKLKSILKEKRDVKCN